jgi:predicted  nucleic acid-binding Zn-ribbon protein
MSTLSKLYKELEELNLTLDYVQKDIENWDGPTDFDDPEADEFVDLQLNAEDLEEAIENLEIEISKLERANERSRSNKQTKTSRTR